MPEPLITNSTLKVKTHFVTASGIVIGNQRNNNESPRITENDSSSSLNSAASPTPRPEESTSLASKIKKLEHYLKQFTTACTTDIEKIVIQPMYPKLAPEKLERYSQVLSASLTSFTYSLERDFNRMLPADSTCSLSELATCLDGLLKLLNEQIKEARGTKDNQVEFFKFFAREFYNTFVIIIKNIWEKITDRLNTLKKNVKQLFLQNINQIPSNSSKLKIILLFTEPYSTASPSSLHELKIYLIQLFDFLKEMKKTNQFLAEFLKEMNQAYRRSSWHIFGRNQYKTLRDIIKRLKYAANISSGGPERPTHRSSTYTALESVLSCYNAESLFSETRKSDNIHTDIPLHEAFLTEYVKKNRRKRKISFSLEELNDFTNTLSELIKWAFDMDKAFF